LHVHTAGLIALVEAHALNPPELEFDEVLRKTHALFESVLKEDDGFVHYSTGEGVDTGLWGLKLAMAADESLADRVEVALVTLLQNNPDSIFIDIEDDLNLRFPGLLTPSKGLIYAVLNSYAEKDGARWKLRPEDVASARRVEMNNILNMLEVIGKRLGYETSREEKTILWEEGGQRVRSFYVLASALISRALENADEQTVIVIPGGRAALIAYKQQRDPALAVRLKRHKVVKYRLVRALSEVPILTPETFEEQIVGDPVEQSKGKMMMF
jgi:hypothetical protein